ncbi:MAG: CHAD domain-containing protein [Betaproteobacteria bacterium]|nr:MAG: CHAD domain-containing protein [Betaproteobacteria bacterium]
MPQEIELKLAADPATLASLPQHPVLGPLLNGSPRRAKLLSRYYDTAAAELHEAGVALRLRRDGRQWLQTVKGPGSAVAGMHQRAEYEWKIAHPRLDFPKLATTPWHKTFVAVNGRLKSLFSTDILRISHPLAFADGTRATLCLDRGFIVAKGRRSPICELEIELIDGDAQRLRELGLQLTTDLPLAVAHRSKAERGYALAGAIPRQPVRARRVALPDHASAAAAVAAVGADCLEQIGANAEAVADGEDSEFVHQLRVGVRRLRSLLKFLATLIPPEEIAPLDEELSWISGATGVARDWDVFVSETLASITPQLESTPARRALGQLKARATRVRLAQRAAMREAAASPRLARLLLALGELFAKLASAPPSEAAASAHAVAENELGRRDKRLSKRVRGMRHASPTQRHRARIAAKKLRYASEFFAPLYSKSRAADYIDALAKLQGALGTLNDLATAGRLLGEIVPKDPSRTIAEAAGIVRGWIAASTVSELAHAAKARRAFAKLKPFWS